MTVGFKKVSDLRGAEMVIEMYLLARPEVHLHFTVKTNEDGKTSDVTVKCDEKYWPLLAEEYYRVFDHLASEGLILPRKKEEQS